ncbi:MAG: phosphate signaling complex protein PhoU [Caldilineaceae bacterium]|jgi:phosphate transport system protein|nr:phosphate signaling complex protein PhoU [Caldilineaceae bacterium]
MIVRAHFERKLNELRDEILYMGGLVEAELTLALDAFRTLDAEKAKQVSAADRVVNKTRFDIEEKCFSLIVTQQPAARDLRTITTAMNIIIDLERMGDQAKGVAKVVPRLLRMPTQEQPPELWQMGEMVGKMLSQVMLAFANSNIDLARIIAKQDDEVDALYARVFTRLMAEMAAAGSPEQVEAAYEVLRVARELERFGDLVTNVGERIIYLVTGSLDEIN